MQMLPASSDMPGRMIFLCGVTSAAQDWMFQARGELKSALAGSPPKLRARALAAAHGLDTAMYSTASARCYRRVTEAADLLLRRFDPDGPVWLASTICSVHNIREKEHFAKYGSQSMPTRPCAEVWTKKETTPVLGGGSQNRLRKEKKTKGFGQKNQPGALPWSMTDNDVLDRVFLGLRERTCKVR
jgi:hypothetical protein